jgi:mannose-6-phosphate isomerase-like protein (cupin superfamily)
MQRFILIIFYVLFAAAVHGQKIMPDSLNPNPAKFENIQIQKIAEDSFQSSFIIWVKEAVKPHYHAHHSEYIHVLKGCAMMSLGDTLFSIKQGDVVFIPQGTIHAVHSISDGPLKVISIQTPFFDGDRIWIDK